MEKETYIELFPVGVSIEAGEFATPRRPVMFFKDKDEKYTLPVWLSPLDAGIVLSESNQRMPSSSPHNLTQKIFSNLGVKVASCVFTELKGHYQFVRLHFEGSDKFSSIDSRADEAISFCINAKAKFFCQHSFIERCKVLDSSMLDLPGHQAMQSRISKNLRTPYLN